MPTELGLLGALQMLYLDFSSISGTLPTEVGNMSMLQKINLGSTNVTGTLPSEIGLMRSLQFLGLGSTGRWSETSFNGTIPSQMCKLSNLKAELASGRTRGLNPRDLTAEEVRNDFWKGIFHNGLPDFNSSFSAVH